MKKIVDGLSCAGGEKDTGKTPVSSDQHIPKKEVMHKWRPNYTACGLRISEIKDGVIEYYITRASYWWKDVTCKKCLDVRL